MIYLNIFNRKNDGWYIGLNDSDRGLRFKGEPKMCVEEVNEFYAWSYKRKHDQGNELEALEGITCL